MCAPTPRGFGVKPPVFENIDIHVHVPEGATPKDGPVGRRGDGHLDCVRA